MPRVRRSKYGNEAVDNAQLASSLAQIATEIKPNMSTSQIQSILDSNRKVLFLDGVFNVNPLFVKSNTVIYMSPNTLIKANTGYTSRQSVLCLHECENVVIYGNNATIQMIKTEYTTGEWRHCVELWQTKNIKIYNLNAIDSGGDGFFIGTDDFNRIGTNENILLHECNAKNNRRQGLSICNARNLTVFGGVFEGTIGTAPEYGIDIEPSYDFEYAENVKILNAKTQNNAGGGILIALGYCKTQTSILIDGYWSYNEGEPYLGAIAIAGGSGTETRTGNITMRNINIVNPLTAGVWIQSQRTNIEPIYIENINITNPASGVGVDNAQSNGVHIETLPGDTYATYGNITIKNITVNDNRTTKLLYSPIAIYGKAGTTLKNIIIDNLSSNGWVNGVANPVLYSGSAFENFKIVNYEKRSYETFEALTLTRYNGMNVISASNTTLTLPDTSLYKGFEVTIQVTSVNNLIVACQSTNKINDGTQKTQLTGSGIGSYLTLKSDNAGNWNILSKIGTWT
jgi:hypothetical protein